MKWENFSSLPWNDPAKKGTLGISVLVIGNNSWHSSVIRAIAL